MAICGKAYDYRAFVGVRKFNSAQATSFSLLRIVRTIMSIKQYLYGDGELAQRLLNERATEIALAGLMNKSFFKSQAPHEAIIEYWGLMAICRRMNWKNSRTPVRQALNHGFPLYLKTRVGQTRQFYYSTEKLITSWEWSRCEREIERLVRNTLLAHDMHAYRPSHQEPSRDIPNT